MSFGFPAYATGSQTFQLSQEQLIQMVAETLNQLGWQFGNPSAITFLAHKSINIWSWGEKINIDVIGDGTVLVRSECALPTQCIDWGKNKRNIALFFDKLSPVISICCQHQLQQPNYFREMSTPVERLIKTEREN